MNVSLSLSNESTESTESIESIQSIESTESTESTKSTESTESTEATEQASFLFLRLRFYFSSTKERKVSFSGLTTPQ